MGPGVGPAAAGIGPPDSGAGPTGAEPPGAGAGRDSGSAVSQDYGPDGNEFPGTVNWVQIETGKDGGRHPVSPEDRWRVAMARQ